MKSGVTEFSAPALKELQSQSGSEETYDSEIAGLVCGLVANTSGEPRVRVESVIHIGGLLQGDESAFAGALASNWRPDVIGWYRASRSHVPPLRQEDLTLTAKLFSCQPLTRIVRIPEISSAAAAILFLRSQKRVAAAGKTPDYAWTRYLVIASTLALAIALPAAWLLRPAPPRFPVGLGLKVEKQATGLLVTWNHQAAELADASSAVFRVSGSGQTRDIDISPAELRRTDLFYTTSQNNLQLELVVNSPAGSYSQSVRVLGGKTSEPLPTQVQPPSNESAPQPPSRPEPMLRVPGEKPAFQRPPAIAKQDPPAKLAAALEEPVITPGFQPSTGAVLAVALPPQPVAQPVPAPPSNTALITGTPSNAVSGTPVFVPARPLRPIQPMLSGGSVSPALTNMLTQSDKPFRVEVVIDIDERGNVKSLRFKRSLGPYSHVFADSIIGAVNRARFVPASLAGKPVASTQTLLFDFKSVYSQSQR